MTSGIYQRTIEHNQKISVAKKGKSGLTKNFINY